VHICPSSRNPPAVPALPHCLAIILSNFAVLLLGVALVSCAAADPTICACARPFAGLPTTLPRGRVDLGWRGGPLCFAAVSLPSPQEVSCGPPGWCSTATPFRRRFAVLCGFGESAFLADGGADTRAARGRYL